MALSSDLISQFVKITNDESKSNKKTETTVYGTIVESGGSKYVQLDGSELLTPISTTTDTKPGERVTVMIKNHSAIVTGNVSSPSARTEDVSNVKNKVDGLDIDGIHKKISEFEIIVADKVSTDDLDAEKARIDNLESKNVEITEQLTANDADIDELKADTVEITEQLTASSAEIENLKTTKLDVEVADAKFVNAEELEATNASVHNLEATYADFSKTTTDTLEAVDASIKDLEANKVSANDIEGKYANIDFSNISKATMQWFYANSGLIENVVVGDGTITGNLVGVTIKGDLIEGNTIKADKLVIKGADGIYYKLNTNGVTTEAEQTDQNSLNGGIITAKSITATKISVDDLVAFDATIGGFNITDNALYSGAKETVSNNTRGIYLDSDGQMSVGDASNYIKYYKDTDGSYKLAISAASVIFAASDTNVEEVISEIQGEITETSTRAESLIQQLSDSMSTLVTDGNGTSLMTQTDEGWTFSTADIQTAINTASENLDSLNNEMGSVSSTVGVLEQAVQDLGEIAEYVKIGTYEGEPCIELGEADSDFKLIITNTRIMFMEGSGVPAYINNQSLHIKKAVVEEELQQGGFVWKARSNGNLGLVWKGVTS